VVVHTRDRWSRNARVALGSLAILGRNNVALVSITDNIDYSTQQGRLLTTKLAGFVVPEVDATDEAKACSLGSQFC